MITTDAVEAWEKYTLGLKTIAFCCSIKHAENVAENYNELGQKLYGRNIATHISSNTPENERKEIIKRMSLPIEDPDSLLITTNFNLVSEGLDIPSVSVTQWLRQTASEILYDQGNGRSNRYVAGKTQYILDHVGNIERFGLPCRPRSFSLQAQAKKKKPIVCVNCQTPFKYNELLEENLGLDMEGKYWAQCSVCGHFTLIKSPNEPAAEPRDRRLIPDEFTEQIQELEYLDKKKAKERDILKLLQSTYDRARGKERSFFNFLAVIPGLTLDDYRQVIKKGWFNESQMFSGFSKRSK